MDEDDQSSILRKIDELEQRSLNTKCILNTSTPLADGEGVRHGDRTTLVRLHFAEKLNMPAAELHDISAYSFDDEGKKFVIDFTNAAFRSKLFKRFREVKPPGEYLNDFLTKRRHNLLYEIRQLREANPRLKKMYSDYGRVFVLLDGATRPQLVHTIRQVKELLRD